MDGPVSESKGDHVVDYRHVIHALRKKPMAAQQSGLPRSIVPRARPMHEPSRRLHQSVGDKRACKLTVELLAHDRRACETELAGLIDAELDAGRLPDLAMMHEPVRSANPASAYR